MTPVPPPDSPEDILEMTDLVEDATSKKADDAATDADFEQELEDLFSEELDDGHGGDAYDAEPVLLDEPVDSSEQVEAPAAEEEEAVMDLTDVVEDDSDTLLLDDIAEESDEADALLLDEVVEEPDEAVLLEDVVEADEVAQPVEEADDADAVVLDDVIEEVASDDEAASSVEPVVADADGADDTLVLDDVVEEAAAVSPEESSENALDLDGVDVDDILAEDEEGDAPVSDEEIAALDDLLDDIDTDEPSAEEDSSLDLDALLDEGSAGEGEENIAQEATGEVADDAGMDASIEDMEPPLDDVDVSAVLADDGDEIVADLAGASLLDDDLGLDAGVDVSDEVDVNELMGDVSPESVGVGDLVSRMDALEERFALLGGSDEGGQTLEERIASMEEKLAGVEELVRSEVERLVPSEAARIIREEIEHLARELDSE